MSESDDSDPRPGGLPEALRRKDAAEAARQRAIAPAQRPRSRPKSKSMGGYAQQALSNEMDTLRKTGKGRRNEQLNIAAFNLGQLVQPGGLTFEEVRVGLTSAALYTGLKQSELDRWDLPDRGIRDGMKELRDLAEISRAVPTKTSSKAKADRATQQRRDTDGDWDSEDDDDEARTITLRSLATVKTKVAQWVWKFDDKYPLLQLGTFGMFAGKSGVGKSTATRWVAARLTRGELPGVWFDVPMNVAVIMQEEQEDYTIAPSLQAADANMQRVFAPIIRESGTGSLFASIRDERDFTEQLIDNEIRAVFVDPVMSTISGKADGNRNNEVRDYLMPYVRMAQAINGIVVGVHHFRKGNTDNVMDSLTGSSAFVELPRAVIGFGASYTGMCVMEQVKNSAGPSGLKLEYRLPVEYMTMDDGVSDQITRFEITGQTELSVADIDGERDELTTVDQAAEWLIRYLEIEQPRSVKDTKTDAYKEGISERTLARTVNRLSTAGRMVSRPSVNPEKRSAERVYMLTEFAESYGRI